MSQVTQTVVQEPPDAHETMKRLKSMAVASAAKISASMLDNSRLPPPPPKAVLADPGSIADMLPPLKRARHAATLSHEAQQAATNDLMNLLEVSDDAKNPVTHVKVPASLAGLVIGKGGGGIKTIEAETGTRVWVEDDPDDQAMRTCVIRGGESAQAAARAIIQRILSQAQDVCAHEKWQTAYQERVQVPETHVPYIIGKDGHWIKRVKETTGCRVHVDKATPVGTVHERSFLLEGSYRAVKMGREQIELQILYQFRRQKVFNPELEEKFKGVDVQSAFQSFDQERVKVGKAFSSKSQPPPPPPVVQEGFPSSNIVRHDYVSAAPGVKTQPEVFAMSPHNDDPTEYFKVLARWASFYSRDVQCVSYYSSIRSCAAQAYCTDASSSGGS